MISIIIVGYNSGEFLKKCIDSVYAQSYKDFEIIFIDNCSSDNSLTIARSYPGLKIIRNTVNAGFPFAVNQGIRASKGDYVLTLNSDVVLDGNFLIEMEKAAESSYAGLFSAKILNSRDKRIDSTGLVLSRSYRFFDRGSGEIDNGQYDSGLDIFGPCAAAALYKREMLEDVSYGGEYFDEDFFFSVEDFDLAWRALQRGWRACFVPGATCYHFRNGSNSKRKFIQYFSFRNRFFLLKKNNAISIKYLFVFLLYDMPRLAYMLFTNRRTFKALYEIMKYTPKKAASAINRKPHILNIVHRYHPAIGGAEMYVKEISERLAADGCRVTVFTTDAWDLEHFWKPGKRRVKDSKESCEGVNIERFRVFRFPFHNIIMRAFYQLPFMFFKALFSLPSPVLPGMWKRLFFDNHDRFDMVHVTALPYNSLIYMAMRYAKKHNIPLIITPFLHLGEHKNDKVRRYYTRDFQMKLLSGSSRIIVQTLIECDYLKGIGIDEKKISIVGQGVNIEDIQGGDKARFRKRFDIEEKGLVFHIAAKSYDKGTFHVVEAMKRVWENNKDVKLVLAGPPMDEFNKYFSAQDSLVKEKCLVLDSIMNEDKKDLFAAGDVLVLPSRTDSFGAVFLEAWASKKPVIGAMAGGIPEVIKHEEDGYLVRFSDIEAISHYIERLLGDRDLARTMGEKGYSKTQDSSTWDERCKALKDLFSKS